MHVCRRWYIPTTPEDGGVKVAEVVAANLERLTRDRQLEVARQRLQRVLDLYIQTENEVRALEQGRFRVVIFGSARIGPQDEAYQQVQRIAHVLAEHNIDIVTGGGPGLMEAANRGVQEMAQRLAQSYGLPLDIPSLNEPANRHLDIKSSHRRFSLRLDEFMRLSNAVLVAPGGIGTMLELMYVWQLLQVGLTNDRPVILLGKAIWSGFLHWMHDTVLAHGYVSPGDLRWLRLVDSEDEVVQLIVHAQQKYLSATGAVQPPERDLDHTVTEEVLGEAAAPTELTEEGNQ